MNLFAMVQTTSMLLIASDTAPAFLKGGVMKSIWKYDLEVTDRQVLKMPVDSKLLTAQVQNGRVCLWAEVDTSPESEMKERAIFVFGTGNPYPDTDELSYISTVQMLDGKLVFHVYEGPVTLHWPTSSESVI